MAKKARTRGEEEARRAAEVEIARRRRKADSEREEKASASDIEAILGDMPEVVNPRRREKCRGDLERYLRTYHPETYDRPFSPSHQRFLRKLQEAMRETMWLVESFPRGFGKTSITEGAIEWALNYGHKRFPVIISASAEHAGKIVRSIKSEYESNDTLYEDFPEICHAVRALEGRAQRCVGQRFRGEPTYISWSADELVIPRTLPGYASSGATVYACGWTASLRGLKRKLPWTGEAIRPDFVMIDDPQDDELAQSPAQVTRLLDTIQGAILGLGGHKTRISVAILATIIQVGDAIDRLMDPTEYPAWIAENIPMLQNEPEKIDLWLVEYAKIRRDFDRDDPRASLRAAEAATAHYMQRRREMDTGAVATWPECYSEGEVSAIQHAMNIWIDRGEEFFLAECQGKPRTKMGGGAIVIDAETVAKKTSGLGRRIVPAGSMSVVGFIDVGHAKLNWLVCAWRGDFSGTILDYGEWPEGTRELTNGGAESLTAAVFRGIVQSIEHMAGGEYASTDGTPHALGTILIDCGDPSTRDAVFQAARAQRFPCRVIPSRGRAHHNFKLPDPRKKRCYQNAYLDIWKGLGPVVVHDACVWRERLQRALMAPQGGPGCVDIFGAPADRHRELGTQLTSERLVEKLAGASGEVFKWVRVPGTKNHWLDCAVGCAVAATVEGLRHGAEIGIGTRRRHIRFRGGSGVSAGSVAAEAVGDGTAGGGSGRGSEAEAATRPRRGGFRALD